MLRWIGRFRPHNALGRRGEAAAAAYLKRRGYRIIQRGARRRFGELDIVAVDLQAAAGRTIVFVEVKTRSSHDAGHPADAVDERKQQRLTRVGLAWLKGHGLLESPARFDVVSVTWPPGSRHPTIEHFANAFEARGGSMFG